MKKRKVEMWTTIYFYAGPDIATQCVLTSDLPRLSGSFTYWRELESDEERARLMKSQIANTIGFAGQNAYRQIS